MESNNSIKMKALLVKQNDNSITEILEGNPKKLYIGFEEFKNHIVTGNQCFICGENKNTKKFNYEHVFPKWILRDFNLYDKKMTLPNRKYINYSQYTVTSCKDCNTRLGEIMEKRLSKLNWYSFKDFYNSFVNEGDLPELIYQWINLIYIKVFLKSNTLKFDLINNSKPEKIGEIYDWSLLHHIYCMSRIHYTKAKVNSSVYGTLIILPAIMNEELDKFDYIDNPFGVVVIRLGAVVIFAVLNDSCYTYNFCKPIIEKISAPLNSFQIKEIYAHLTYVNLTMNPRPVYSSNINNSFEYVIEVKLPENCELLQSEEFSFGELLHSCVQHDIPENVPNREQILEEIRQNKRSYLFDAKGDFIVNKH